MESEYTDFWYKTLNKNTSSRLLIYKKMKNENLMLSWETHSILIFLVFQNLVRNCENFPFAKINPREMQKMGFAKINPRVI